MFYVLSVKFDNNFVKYKFKNKFYFNDSIITKLIMELHYYC